MVVSMTVFVGQKIFLVTFSARKGPDPKISQRGLNLQLFPE